MKRLFTIAASLLLLSSVGFAQKSVVKSLKMRSNILGVEKEYSIYLPEGYEQTTKSYPVLYLLHGGWASNRSWVEQCNLKNIVDKAIMQGAARDMIIVMPDAKGEAEDLVGKHMGYYNVTGWAYEDYFFREFIPFIDKTFRTIPDKSSRAIAGISMGGGAAIAYTERHPEMFGTACSLSGLLGEVSGIIANHVDLAFQESVRLNSPIWFVDNLDDRMVEVMRNIRWYIDCGDDDFLSPSNITFYRSMLDLNIPIQFRVRDGEHNWNYWQKSLPEILQFVSTGFQNRFN